MNNNNPTYVEKPFRIENCIMKGKVIPCKPSHKSLGQLLFDCMKKNLNFVGQVDTTTWVEDTFEAMLDRSIKCALWMQKQGVKKGDIIAISSHNHLDDFICAIAALFIGAIYNGWFCGMDLKTARHFTRMIQPKIVFANERSAPIVMEAAKLEGHQPKMVVFGEYPGTTPYSEVLKGHSESSVANFKCTEIESSEQIAVIVFSSGTTGLPKGVQLSHRSILDYVELDPEIPFKGQTVIWFSTLFWISATILNLWCIVLPSKKIIAPNYEEESACKIIEKCKVTWLGATASIANRLARYNRLTDYDLSSLKVLYTGGSFIGKKAEDILKKRFPHTTVVQTYGMTELGNIVTIQTADSESGSCGKAAVNCEIKIVDFDSGKALGPYQNGELCAKNTWMMSGYYKDPEATRNTIDKDGWVHSGDVAYYNEKGDIFIVDRLKDIIKFRAHQIVPAQVEEVLQSHPAVLEVAVVSMPDPIDGEHPIAFVCKISNKEVSEEELAKLLSNNSMDHYHLRGWIKFLPSLPHTPSGKVSRKELKEMAKSLADC